MRSLRRSKEKWLNSYYLFFPTNTMTKKKNKILTVLRENNPLLNLILRPSTWQSIKQFLKFFVPLSIGLLITNQIVQPLWSPRISEMTISPLYIQLDTADQLNPPKYYGVYKVSYRIQNPLLRRNTSLNLQLPGRTKESSFREPSDAQWIFYYQVQDPHYIIDITEEEIRKKRDSRGFIDIADLTIPIVLQKSGLKQRETSIELFLREETSAGHIDYSFSNPGWYSDNKVMPTFFNGEFYTQPKSTSLGFAINKYTNRTYEVGLITLKSLTDVRVNSLAINGAEKDWICAGPVELSKQSGHVLVELAPHQTINLITIDRFEGESPKWANTFLFRGGESEMCPGIWPHVKDYVN